MEHDILSQFFGKLLPLFPEKIAEPTLPELL